MAVTRLVVPIAAATLLALPVAALAQPPGWQTGPETARHRYAADAQRAYYEVRRTAYDNGYREGVRRGELDARRGNRQGYHNLREFQRADAGYHRTLGDRDRYRQVFRDGFAAGYSDAYARFARYGGSDRRQGPYAQGAYRGPGVPPGGGYYTPALDNGMRDGHQKGLEDARRNRTFDPLRHSWYRSGDRHYQNRYGSRDQYKDAYRRAFQQGYERGYREGRYIR